MENVIASRETRPRAFPALTEEQIDRNRPLGRIRQVRSGDILIKPGDTVIPFYVLLSGHMEIVQPSLDGERMIAYTSRAGSPGK
jgi:CRP-like cAMP-binding protein